MASLRDMHSMSFNIDDCHSMPGSRKPRCRRHSYIRSHLLYIEGQCDWLPMSHERKETPTPGGGRRSDATGSAASNRRKGTRKQWAREAIVGSSGRRMETPERLKRGFRLREDKRHRDDFRRWLICQKGGVGVDGLPFSALE
jgi:hypothetical protein